MKRLAILAAAATIAMAALTGCSSSEVSFSWDPNEAQATMNGLDGEAEGRYDLSWQDMEFDVQLESGSVDVQIVDVLLEDESAVPTEYGTLYEGTRLTNGDGGSFSDPDGSFILRITGHDATGVINIKQK
jgi:hypothetical protein